MIIKMKKILFLIITAALCLSLSACSESSSSPDYTFPPSSEQARLSESEAKTIALNHAGFTEDKVTFTEIKLDHDNGVYEYELEFITDTTEYEYEIGMDGAVLSYSSKLLPVNTRSASPEVTETAAANPPDETQTSTSSNASDYTEANGTSEPAQQDSTSPASNYTGANDASNAQNYPEINITENTPENASENTPANTAASIPANTQATAVQYSAVISEQEAKNTALNNAGFTEAQVTFTEIKLDCDDDCPYYGVSLCPHGYSYDDCEYGCHGGGHHGHHGNGQGVNGSHCHSAGCHYEIEFVAGNIEYEYEIGINGEITGYKTENIYL